MQVDNFIQVLDQTALISSIAEEELMPIIKEFPYCQTSQMMYAIQLHAANSILFDEQLKKAASICPDRTKLFENIHEHLNYQEPIIAEEPKENKETLLVDNKFVPTEGKDELDILEKEYLSQAISSTILLEAEEPVEKVEVLKEVNLFDDKKEHSFSSWLKHYNGDEEEASLGNAKAKHSDIINKFIQEDPRIKPKKTEFYSPTNMARLSVTDSGIVSETLALIHVDQANFQKAIDTYEQLMLKNPKKRSYFAAQIKILKQKLK